MRLSILSILSVHADGLTLTEVCKALRQRYTGIIINVDDIAVGMAMLARIGEIVTEGGKFRKNPKPSAWLKDEQEKKIRDLLVKAEQYFGCGYRAREFGIECIAFGWVAGTEIVFGATHYGIEYWDVAEFINQHRDRFGGDGPINLKKLQITSTFELPVEIR